MAAASAAQAAGVEVDRIGELMFRWLFGAEPRLSQKRRLQLRRTAGQLERTALFGKGAPPGLAAEQLALWMAATADELRRPPKHGSAPARPQSLAYFVVKLRRQARKWRDTDRRRRGAADPKGEGCVHVSSPLDRRG